MNGAERRAWIAKHQEAADKLAAEWQVEKWEVRFSHMLRTSRGNAHLVRRYINIAESMPSEEDYEQTFLHECAHMIAWSRYGERGHGAAWRSIYIKLGGDGWRTYSGESPREVAARTLEERGIQRRKRVEIGGITYIKSGRRLFIDVAAQREKHQKKEGD